ncbi:UbiX family flavin prenyltransferase [Nocardia sp. CDC186]|uniref:Flavin prenyltransferase UbiX n=1 Tax=Nocardia implantans TaxID=3108168 RepID=A0ABU6AXF7_9NOCA|nr:MULTISPECIES: UbiX family flavin prenyltransferase [unclassified Nocardia]MBF6193672.1 UbiX family flavin prenyltransferase [Nocardia beijingensis]MEA3529590.1 UbiX family flavin prenyltransferase [Nocardia sp. CDC192]MEB3512176.1 UbiX family flavin prenyltransferase [Nocardia sp. CDC186]
MTPTPTDRIVVGVTGATGIVYAVRALDVLRTVGIETHLVVTKAADLTRAYETDLSRRDLTDRADHVWALSDVGAPLSSGSFHTRGMLIAPASMRSVGEIASGVTSSLLTRAADVTLKERRPLVLLAREAPLTLIHLRNMVTITEAGGTIMPPVPAYYFRPRGLEDVIDHTVGRALDQFGIHTDIFPRWDDELRRSVTRPGEDPVL